MIDAFYCLNCAFWGALDNGRCSRCHSEQVAPDRAWEPRRRLNEVEVRDEGVIAGVTHDIAE